MRTTEVVLTAFCSTVRQLSSDLVDAPHKYMVYGSSEASFPPRIQRSHVPQRTFIESSIRLYRTRFYEICGTGKCSAIVDEPLRSKRKCSRGQVFEEPNSFSRMTGVLAFWTFCYTRGYQRWFSCYRLSRIFHYFELRGVRWGRSYERRSAASEDPERMVSAQLGVVEGTRHSCTGKKTNLIAAFWSQPYPPDC